MQNQDNLRLNKFSFTGKKSKMIFSLLAIAQLVLAPLAMNKTAFAQTTTSPAVIIYDNGPLATGATSRSGVAAPAGAQWSEVQCINNDTECNNTAGFVAAQGLMRTADDFTVPAGQTWTINQVIVFAYLTGATGTTSPFTGASLRIWNGPPGATGSTVLFGDITTNRLASSTDTNIFRIFNTVGPLAAAPGTTRRIWQINMNVSPALVLTSGTYWIDYATVVNNNPATNHFIPTVTIPRTRALPGWNALQSTAAGTTYTPLVDPGNPTTAPDYPQDFPFQLEGSVTGGSTNAPISRKMDFNGDNRSDFVIARATAANAATDWWIRDSAGNIRSTRWGLGVGFTGGDIAVPEDYDGDGRTDIAVWRSGTQGFFYILQSSNNTLRTERFGRQGDNPRVVRDYDGDGKADAAVYRPASSGVATDPCGTATSGWYFRPSGTAGVEYRYACFGAANDKPFPGDFDGDGRGDFSVVRDSGGNAVHYQSRTSAGFRALTFGSFTDRFVSGDFDGDGRTDLALVRASGSVYLWYISESASGQTQTVYWGSPATDYITPGDYDGDNRTDFAVWRSGTGADSGYFFVLNTASAPLFLKWGQSAGAFTPPDYPVAAYQVH